MSRRKSRPLLASSPPPSPIPRADGSRSAANESFTRFLDSSLQVPGLTLPESHQFSPASAHPRDHDDDDVIDFESIMMRDGDSIDKLVRLAREFGAFRIDCHVLLRELQSSVNQILKRDCGNKVGNRDEILRVRRSGTSPEWVLEHVEAPNCELFSRDVENVASKLEAITKEVGKVLSEALNRKLKTEEGEATFSIYSYNRSQTNISPQSSDSSVSGLRVQIHIGMKQSGFCRWRTGVVTLGKQLEEWSLGELKSVSMTDDGPRKSFTVEYNYSFRKINQTLGVDRRTISILDQIVIFIFITCLLKIFLYMYS